MTADERLERLLTLPYVDSDIVNLTRYRRPSGAYCWELRLARSLPTHGELHFFGDTFHEALLGAEKELLGDS